MTKLAELGRIVAARQDLELVKRVHDPRAAQRFARQVTRPEPRRSVRVALAVVVTATAAAAVVAFGFGHARDATSQRGEATIVAAGKRFVVAERQTLPLSFPDGSEVVLASGTEAAVRELSVTGAKVEVERGNATFAVRHQDHTNWSVGAGPYHVRVTGTRFSVSWAPASARFELYLEQGSVVVTADTGTHAAVTMIAPASLLIDDVGWKLGPAAASEPETEVVTPSVPAEPAPPAPSATVIGAAPVAARLPPPPSWEDLAHAGKYRDAYDGAARRGIASLADTGSPQSLLSLAEVCRFSAHGPEAVRVLSRLRARFPSSEEAAIAAFQLGRVSSDAAAVTWFRTYLRERPKGALAREASGRLLEALSRSGDRQGAQNAAAPYLAQYPDGPHAAFAHQLLDR